MLNFDNEPTYTSWADEVEEYEKKQIENDNKIEKKFLESSVLGHYNNNKELCWNYIFCNQYKSKIISNDNWCNLCYNKAFIIPNRIKIHSTLCDKCKVLKEMRIYYNCPNKNKLCSNYHY